MDHKKLQTFIFSDNFGWAFPDVQTEAFNSAIRRAEMMGWSEVSIKPISTLPILEGDVRNYKFEIWGIGESIVDGSDGVESSDDSAESFRQVAKEIDL